MAVYIVDQLTDDLQVRSTAIKFQVNEGSPGPPGLSAYQIAVNNGFSGTESEWLASLQGGTDPKINFSFGDASPSTILTTVAGQYITSVQVVITTPFNGTIPTISIGDAVDANRLFPSTAIDVKESAEWEYNPNYFYATATPLLLTITPSGSTQGSGFILFERK